ncbi:MAG TPA: DUF2214 domain-containing protein [Gammaproteobacteria bacterium]|nr:DUF2214 domain-containing protein [Gammaproteobacteria bacterium]
MSLRSAGVWTYAVFNLGHIAGIGTLFGSVLLLDLRLLGCWRGIGLATISRPSVPLAIAGFALAVATGVCMLTFNASEYYGNPFFLIKFPAIALGLVNVVVVSRMRAWRARAERELSAGETLQLAVAGGFSLACWATALGAGRMIGYW